MNALTMIALVGWIVFEAAQRFFEPVEVLGGLMLWVAAGGLLVNVLAFWLLHSGEKENLNMQGAAVHVLGDLLGSVAAIAAAIVILYTGWTPIDPLLSVFVAMLILRSAIALARQSGHILMEGTPRGLDIEEIKNDLLDSVAGIEDVHHLHAWSLTATRDVMTLHARIAKGINPDEALNAINDRLRHKFQIEHATVQIETEACS